MVRRRQEKQPDDPVGAMIRRLREQAGMTQAELAFQVGVDTRSVQRWEAPVKGPGKGTSPGALELLRVLATFGIEVPEAPRYRALASELDRIHRRLDQLLGAGVTGDDEDMQALVEQVRHPAVEQLAAIVEELQAPRRPSPARLAELRQAVDAFAEANRTGSRLAATLQARLEAADTRR